MAINNDKIEQKRKRRSKSFCELVDLHIIDCMTKGMSPIMIIKDLEDNFEFATSDNARAAIRRCNAKLAEVNKESFDEKVAKYLEIYHNLYKQTIEASEFRTANSIMDSIVKLEGLLTQKIETKVENTGSVNLTNITDEKLEQLVDKILNNNVKSEE